VGVPLDLAVLGEEPKMVASMVRTQTAILTTSHLLIFPLPVRTNPFCALKFALHCIKNDFLRLNILDAGSRICDQLIATCQK
jgi:hypothetical protein